MRNRWERLCVRLVCAFKSVLLTRRALPGISTTTCKVQCNGGDRVRQTFHLLHLTFYFTDSPFISFSGTNFSFGKSINFIRSAVPRKARKLQPQSDPRTLRSPPTAVDLHPVWSKKSASAHFWGMNQHKKNGKSLHQVCLSAKKRS